MDLAEVNIPRRTGNRQKAHSDKSVALVTPHIRPDIPLSSNPLRI